MSIAPQRADGVQADPGSGALREAVPAPRFDSFEHHPGGAVTGYAYFEPAETVMWELAEELFSRNWQRIIVGPWVEGALFALRFAQRPAVRFSDGYVTVDPGPWNFHLCIGAHGGSDSAELRAKRPVAKVAFFEKRGRGCAGGRTWGLRLWNGYGEQMTTVLLPNAYLSDELRHLDAPDWSRLDFYYSLRARFLGEPVPADLEAAANLPFLPCHA